MKVVIKLDSSLPSTVVVKDVQGNTARVAVEYPRPPPKCLNCGRYGHLLSRCPKPLMKQAPFKKDRPSGAKEVTHPTVSLPSHPSTTLADVIPTTGVELVLPLKTKRRRSRSGKRSSSTPPMAKEPLDKQCVLPVPLPVMQLAAPPGSKAIRGCDQVGIRVLESQSQSRFSVETEDSGKIGPAPALEGKSE